MGYTVVVDAGSCMSTGNCVRNAPDAFAFDDDDVSTPQPAAEVLGRERLVQVARSCPAGAIHVFADGEEIDPHAP